MLPDELSYVDGAMLACGVGTVYEALSRMRCRCDPPRRPRLCFFFYLSPSPPASRRGPQYLSAMLASSSTAAATRCW